MLIFGLGTAYHWGMITSSLRRAGLAVAVIAALSLRAAAQSDAAFASALGQGVPTPAQFAQAKAKPQKPAPPVVKPPSAPDAVWQKVLETVKNGGIYKPGADPMPSAFTIDDSSGDAKADHETHSIAVLGLINDDEKFEAMGAILVFKSHKLDPKDGNWRIDQWMFMTDIYGEVADAGHGVIIQTPDGKTVSATPEKLNPADPKIQAQYDTMLKHWAERKPKGA